VVGARTKLVLIAVVGIALLGMTLAVVMRPTTTPSTDAGYSGSLLPEEVPVVDFALSDERGEPISLKTVAGGPAILTFLFTSCKDICPLTAQQIRGALDQAGHDVPVIAISVDAKGDTPTTVKPWLAGQQMTGRMHWALGTQNQLAKVWNSYGVAGQTRQMDHSAYVFVLDRDGKRCVSWPVSQLTPEGLAHDIKLLLSRDGNCRY